MVDKNQYKFDDQILKLKTFKAKAYIKILGIPIKSKKKILRKCLWTYFKKQKWLLLC